jgi:hypothetical protein
MPEINTNPDRDFSADYRPKSENARDLIKHSEVAEYDDAARQRLGYLLGQAIFNPNKPFW